MEQLAPFDVAMKFFKIGIMVFKTVGTGIDDTCINGNSLKIPKRKTNVLMMKHAFIKRVMPVHGLGTETVDTHHVVYGSAGCHDFGIHFFEKTNCTF